MAKRVPKWFDGTQNPGRRIDQLLPQILQEIALKAQDSRELIFQEWYLLIGEKMASFTEPVSWDQGVLTVKVKSSTLYSLLSRHEKPLLLSQLKKKFPIQEIIFRIG